MVSAKAVRQALYTKLNVASVTTGLAQGSASLHHAMAPSAATYPLVIFNRQASTPNVRFTGTHFDTDIWLVKAIARGGSSSVAEDIDKAVADVLHFQPINITGADDMYLSREGALEYVEEVDGEVFRHHGHTYRLIYQ